MFRDWYIDKNTSWVLLLIIQVASKEQKKVVVFYSCQFHSNVFMQILRFLATHSPQISLNSTDIILHKYNFLNIC